MNTIPGRVFFTIDLRHYEEAVLPVNEPVPVQEMVDAAMIQLRAVE